MSNYNPSKHFEELKRICADKGYVILSGEYIDSVTKLRFKCLKDGYEWEASPSNIKCSPGRGCPKCSGNIRDKSYHFQNILNICKDSGYECLSTEYKTDISKLKFKCLKDGYEWETTPNSIKGGSGCPMCSKMSRDKTYHMEELKKICDERGYEILSKEYSNSITKLRFRCLKDGYEWSAVSGSIKSGCGCPKCGIEKISESRRYKGFDNMSDKKLINNIEINDGYSIYAKKLGIDRNVLHRELKRRGIKKLWTGPGRNKFEWYIDKNL